MDDERDDIDEDKLEQLENEYKLDMFGYQWLLLSPEKEQ